MYKAFHNEAMEQLVVTFIVVGFNSYVWYHMSSCCLILFFVVYSGEIESNASDTSQIAQHIRTCDHVQIDFYPRSVAYTGNMGRVKIPTPKREYRAREQIKDSGIDTCLSSSCQTLSEEALKSKVYKINVRKFC